MRRLLLCFAAGAAFFAVLFSPVLSRGLILGDGADQLVETLPYYLAPVHAWNAVTMLGYPTFANPSGFWWYPLRLLALLGPRSFDLFELTAFAVAFTGGYYLARELTGNRTGGVLAGLVYAASGFMISHVGHLMIVYPAAWVPFVLFALARLRRRFTWTDVAVGALAIACCFGTGQPQIAVYAIYLAVAFSIAGSRRSTYGVFPYLGAAAALLCFGVMLAGIVLLPLAQVVAFTARAHNSFADFSSFSTPVLQVPVRLFFPYVFGRTPVAPYTMSDYDLGGFFELTTYVGLGTLALAGIGAGAARRNADAAFFAAAAFVALLLTTGDGLGLAHLTYHLPLLAGFREPSRHAMEFTLCTAVLAAFGYERLTNAQQPVRMMLRACAGLVAAALVVATGLYFAQPAFQQSLLINGAPAAIRFSPLVNAAEWIPFTMLGVTVAAFLTAVRVRPNVRALFIVAAIALDLVVFASAAYWNYAAFSPSLLQAPAYAAPVRSFVLATHTRVLSLPSADVHAGIPPDLNVLWGIPEARGYTPLELTTAQAFDAADPLDPGALARAAVSIVVVPVATTVKDATEQLRARGWRTLYAGSDAMVFRSPTPPSRAWLIDAQAGTVNVVSGQHIAAHCKRACTLVTSDAYYPGWYAMVDERAVAIEDTGGLRSVALPAGTHDVKFLFLDRATQWGAAISLIAALALAFLTVLPRFVLDRRKVVVG